MTEQIKAPNKEDGRFRLPSSGYEVLSKIIQAYAQGAGKKPAKIDDIAKLAGTNKFVLSSNNAFLSSAGIITGGNLKAVTERGNRLGIALSHDQEEQVSRCWREIAMENEFFESILAGIRIRRGMTKEDLASHIAITAGEPKSNAVLTGARTIVDILERAKLVFEEDGLIKAGPSPEEQEPYPAETEVAKSPGQKRLTVLSSNQTKKVGHYPAATHGTISIVVNVQATAENIGQVLEQVQNFLKSAGAEATEG